MRRCKGVAELVKLFNCDNEEVQRFATGATRNLIYENMDNKVALIDEGGIPQLVEALKETDDELRKNITGKTSRQTKSHTSPWHLHKVQSRGQKRAEDYNFFLTRQPQNVASLFAPSQPPSLPPCLRPLHFTQL